MINIMFSTKLNSSFVRTGYTFNIVKRLFKVDQWLYTNCDINFYKISNRLLWNSGTHFFYDNVTEKKCNSYLLSNIKNIVPQQEIYMQDLIKLKGTLICKDMEQFKLDVISQGKKVTHENIDAIFLSICVKEKALEVGRLYFKYIFEETNKYNLASIAKFFRLCYECRNDCTEEDKKLILFVYQKTIATYDVLDSQTCENVILGLSITSAWKEGFKLLKICESFGESTGTMLSALIVAAFTNGENEQAWSLVTDSLKRNKHLTPSVFALCISNNGNERFNYLLEILQKYNVQVTPDIAKVFHVNYKTINPNGKCKITSIGKNGRCQNCLQMLKLDDLSELEFEDLKKHFLNPVLVGNDIFLKTKPTELQSFFDFINRVGRVDVVLDGLNVAYALGKKHKHPEAASQTLLMAVDYFARMGKKILTIGRKHMNKWPEKNMNKLKQRSLLFLTDNVSADDPYVLYAAINSGFGTIFVSRDLMRNQKFLLKEHNLRNTFSKWQQKYQYHLKHITSEGIVILEKPLPYLQSIQRAEANGGWHLPIWNTKSMIGIPGHLVAQRTSWLCLP